MNNTKEDLARDDTEQHSADRVEESTEEAFAESIDDSQETASLKREPVTSGWIAGGIDPRGPAPPACSFLPHHTESRFFCIVHNAVNRWLLGVGLSAFFFLGKSSLVSGMVVKEVDKGALVANFIAGRLACTCFD